MNRFLLAVLALCISASPALAAQTVYLKEGGKISAQSVWRTKGKVHVLVNRDTLTEFSTAEIDLKRTFAHRHRATKRRPQVLGASRTTVHAAGEPATAQEPGRSNVRFPTLPALTEGNPQSLLPRSEEGTIKKHKREMAEKAGE